MSESSFLSRWSRRKAADRRGEPEAQPEPEPIPPAEAAPSVPTAAAVASEPAAAVESAPDTPPPPTLEDAAKLTPSDDFAPFVARGVDEAVKRAALKKLFADPHFNVMDGLDTYIDDYSRPDPIPPDMLRELRQAAALRLFEPLDDDTAKPAEAELAQPQSKADEGPAQSGEPPEPDTVAQATPHSGDEPPSVQ